MVTVLQEEQWELLSGADSYVFGNGTQGIIVKGGLDYGSSEIKTQTVDRSQSDGSMFGRDTKTGPEWSLTVLVQHGLDVWPVLWEFQAAWDAVSVRAEEGAVCTLRYRRGGRTIRITGRPQKCGIVARDKRNHKAQQIACTFQLENPEAYLEPEDASTRSLTLNLIEAESDGGVVWDDDLTWPIDFDDTSQARVGEVTVGGYRAAPFKVVIHGPVTGTLSKIYLSGDGRAIQTSATLQHDQTLVIDTHTRTITKGGISQAGTLSRTSYLSARLQPGHQFIKFDAVDPTNTAYAVVTWLDTIPA